MQLLSAFGGGLIIIPVLTFIGALIFGYQAYKAHNSNSTTQTKEGIKDNTGNVPYSKIGQSWFAAGLLLATIVIMVIMWNER